MTVSELIQGVNLALGEGTVSCAAFDTDGSEQITVDELTQATAKALGGCEIVPLGITYPNQEHGVGGLPGLSLEVVDLNRDGFPDILTTVAEGASILPGSGDGSFAAPVIVPLDPHAVSVATGDVDGDGEIDLVARLRSPFEVAVLLAVGGGRFGPAQTFPVGDGPIGQFDTLEVADVNGDGRADVIAANTNDDTVTVLSSWSGTRFTRSITLDVAEAPISLGVGDLNGDSLPDILVGSSGRPLIVPQQSGILTIYSGQADGLLAEGVALSVQGRNPVALAIGDLDGDGIADVVTANRLSQDLSLLFGAPGGVAGVNSLRAVPSVPESVVFGDLDGDRTTIEILAAGADEIHRLRNAPSPRRFVPVPPLLAGAGSDRLALADLNGDGHVDVVSLRSAAQLGVAVLLNPGDGRFESRVDPGGSAVSVVAADASGDGIPDLISASGPGSNRVAVHTGRGDGSFEPPMVIEAGDGPVGLAVADFNRDGILDVATANSESKDVSLFLGRRAGGFAEEDRIALGRLASARIEAHLAAGDLNGDGSADLAVNHDGDVAILLGDGDGHFLLADTLEDACTHALSNSLGLADLDGDEDLDLVCGGVRIFPGRGDGTFASGTDFPVSHNPGPVAVGDVNRDGIPDIVSTAIRTGLAEVFVGIGDGTFRQPRSFRSGRGTAHNIELVDLNGDGVPEIVTANPWDADVSILVGRGDGTFRLPLRYSTGGSPTGIAVADFNGDGVPDLAVAHGELSLLVGAALPSTGR